jgi:hypothetical protein
MSLRLTFLPIYPLTFGVGFDRVTDEKGERWVWVDAAVVKRHLRDLRRPGDSDVDVILRSR